MFVHILDRDPPHEQAAPPVNSGNLPGDIYTEALFSTPLGSDCVERADRIQYVGIAHLANKAAIAIPMRDVFLYGKRAAYLKLLKIACAGAESLFGAETGIVRFAGSEPISA
jgi:hypothetical protein